MNATNTCGHCLSFRSDDGYCRIKGDYVNALAEAPARCYTSRAELSVPLPRIPRTERPAARPAQNEPKKKTCKICGRTLPIEEFPHHNTSRDRHECTCRECKSNMMKESAAVKSEKISRKAHTDIYGNPVPDGMRRCTKCQRVLPLSEFGSNKKHMEGVQYECKDCRNAYGRMLYHKRFGGEERTELQRKNEKAKPQPVQVRELTDAEMVDLLRQHGWTVTCTKTELL